MVFSSIAFLMYFLPVLIGVYFIVPKKLKNLVMFAASMVFYAWGEIRFIPVMIGLSLVDYFCGRMMGKYADEKSKKRIFMLIDVLMNLSVLFFFKYSDFFIGNVNSIFGLTIPLLNIALPIGVSFNTFQSISYGIDVYRGTTTCEKSYYNYLTYTTLFPQIIAGPIVRYVTVENELDERKTTIDTFSKGMKRFLTGLGKKVLIANSVGYLWSIIQSGQAGDMTVLLYWTGIIAFAFQIYFDFSGYSDMAIGLAEIFGFKFDENFNYPYTALSITDFWRRWHMTLSGWFRDYVYIPLGGNRCSAKRHILNLAIVWGLTGFWHGASWNFILWGLYFAVFLVIEKYLLFKFWGKVFKPIRYIYTAVVVLVSWVIFSFEDVGLMLDYLKGMFGLTSAAFVNENTLYYIIGYFIIFVIAAICSTTIIKRIWTKLENSRRKAATALVCTTYIFIFMASIAFLVNSTYNPFLYFRF